MYANLLRRRFKYAFLRVYLVFKRRTLHTIERHYHFSFSTEVMESLTT